MKIEVSEIHTLHLYLFVNSKNRKQRFARRSGQSGPIEIFSATMPNFSQVWRLTRLSRQILSSYYVLRFFWASYVLAELLQLPVSLQFLICDRFGNLQLSEAVFDSA